MTIRPELQLSRRERQIVDIIYAGGCKASDYAQHLLEIVRSLHSVHCPSLAAVARARKGQFEGRLLAILDPRRNRRTLTRLGVVLAAAILAAVAVPLAALRATGPETKPAAKPAQPTSRPASASRGEQATLLAKLKSEEFAAFKARAMDTSLNVDQRLYAVMRAAAVENKEAAEFMAFLWDNPLPIKGVEKGLGIDKHRIAEMCAYNPYAEVLLIKALRDPSCDVRRAAMRALPTIIGQQAVGPLKERAETDEDPVTRTVATELLRELSDTARRDAQAAIAAAAIAWARSDASGKYIKGDVVYFVRHDTLRGLEGDSLRLYSEWELKAIDKHWAAYRLSSIIIRGQRATATLSLYMQPPDDPVGYPHCGWRIDLAKVGGQWLAVHAVHDYPWRKPGDDWTRPGYEKEYPCGAELARVARVAQEHSKKIAPILPNGWSCSTRDNNLLVNRITSVSWYSTISLPAYMNKADLVSKGFVQSGGYGIYVSFRSPMTPAEARLLSEKNERANREYYRDHPAPPTSQTIGPPPELTERLHPVPDMLGPDYSVFISTSIQGPGQAFYDDTARAECAAVKEQVLEILSPPRRPAPNGAATQPVLLTTAGIRLDPNSLEVRQYPADNAKPGLCAIGPYPRRRFLPFNSLYASAASGKIPAGSFELVGRLSGDSTPIKVMDFVRDGHGIKILVALSPKKPAGASYIWGGLPANLPPGRYHVELTAAEYEEKDGQLVPAPKTAIRAFYQLECHFTVGGTPPGEAASLPTTQPAEIAGLAATLPGRP
jgi:hypothetical protein